MYIQLRISRLYGSEKRYVFFELNEDLSITFVRNNSLYAFDNMKLERTTSFSIPATDNNLSILDWSNDYHRDGVSIDRKVFKDAIMTVDAYQMVGTLYITEFDFNKREFKCVFTTGDLQALRRLREAGNIGDIIQTDLYLQYGIRDTTEILPSNPWNSVVRAFDGIYRPRYSLEWVLNRLKSEIGFDTSAIPDECKGLSVCIPNPNLPKAISLDIIQDVIDIRQPSVTVSADYNTISVVPNGKSELYFGTTTKTLAYKKLTDNVYYKAVGLQAKYNITIEFPFDFSSDIMILGWETPNRNPVFIGDYGIEISGGVLSIVGEPLAEKKVTINKGWSFIFVNKTSYLYDEWGNSLFEPLIVDTNINNLKLSTPELEEGTLLYLQDNFDKINTIDILKMYAYISGRVLRYDASTSTVIFDDLDFSLSKVVEFNNVIDIKYLKKIIPDYAQNNTIQYDSDVDVSPSRKQLVDYTLLNETIAKQRELYTIKFSEGNLRDETINGATVSTIYISSESTKNILGLYDAFLIEPPNYYGYGMFGTYLIKNPSLQNIIDISNTIEVDVLINMLEYQSIKEKDKIFLDGCYWSWIESKWNKNKATFVLSKIL